MSCAFVLASSLNLAVGEWAGLSRTWIVFTAASVACIGLLVAMPRLPSRASLALVSLQSLLTVAALSISAQVKAAGGHPFSPFIGNKVLTVAIAVFCPSVRLGLVLIGLAVVQPVVHAAFWSTDVRSLLPTLEPWHTLLIGVFCAAGLMVFRRRHAAYGEALARVHAERKWLERVVRLALLVRDLGQAPVRALRDSLLRVRERHTDMVVPIDRMVRSVDRLERLNRALAPLDGVVPPLADSGEDSLDTVVGLLEELQASRLDNTPAAGRKQGRRPRAAPAVKEEARRAVFYNGLVSGIVGIAAGFVFSSRGLSTLGAALVGGAGSLSVALALGVRRLSDRVYRAVFFLSSVCIILGVLILNNDEMKGGRNEGFFSIRVGALLAAFLAPSGRVGAAVLTLLALGPVAESYLWWSAEQRSRLPVFEPWETVFVCLVAFGVLAAQRRRVALVHELAHARAECSGMSRMARLALSVRDYANSPLQTITIGSDTLRQQYPDDRELDDIDSAIVRLRLLTEALSPLSEVIEWDEVDVSFDALQRIEVEVRQSLDESRV